MSRTRGIKANYNFINPEDINTMIYSPFQQALGVDTFERIQKQLENYDYYNGNQHRDVYKQLVKAEDLERPAGLDYDPTRYSTNYFKAFVDRKARWQMGGLHGIYVPIEKIDNFDDTMGGEYEPSVEQEAENKRARDYETLIYKLWSENRMRANLIQAARDRLITDRVVCKIVFNSRTGKLRWLFRPDTEYIPVYSDDDFEDLIGANFVFKRKYEVKGEEVDAVEIQKFSLEDGVTYLHEAIYDIDNLDILETKTEKQSMGLDFIPVQEFPVNELISDGSGDSEISALREQNDVLNSLNEDAIDSMKFEMFESTAILNAEEGAAREMEIAPGAVVDVRSGTDGISADIKKIHGSFGWKDAFQDQYMRVKAAMHEISGLPNVVPQELNFGGINGDALHVLYHDIITDTEEHWLSWGYNLSELHEKSIRYLQSRTGRDNFAYDKDVLSNIGNKYDNEMKFVLPLPDNRKELVELLESETLAGFESMRGALERLGVENVKDKQQEIQMEKSSVRNNSASSYGEDVGDDYLDEEVNKYE